MDPIAESGGVNVYGFVNNAPQRKIDILGLASVPRIPNAAETCCISAAAGRENLGEINAIRLLAEAAARGVLSYMRELYPDSSRYTDDDLMNAFRHCYGACRLARVLGDPNVAWQVEECHEIYGGNSGDTYDPQDPDTLRDRRNNAIGNRLGNTRLNTQCNELCLQEAERGNLTILPVNPPPAGPTPLP